MEIRIKTNKSQYLILQIMFILTSVLLTIVTFPIVSHILSLLNFKDSKLLIFLDFGQIFFCIVIGELVKGISSYLHDKLSKHDHLVYTILSSFYTSISKKTISAIYIFSGALVILSILILLIGNFAFLMFSSLIILFYSSLILSYLATRLISMFHVRSKAKIIFIKERINFLNQKLITQSILNQKYALQKILNVKENKGIFIKEKTEDTDVDA